MENIVTRLSARRCRITISIFRNPITRYRPVVNGNNSASLPVLQNSNPRNIPPGTATPFFSSGPREENGVSPETSARGARSLTNRNRRRRFPAEIIIVYPASGGVPLHGSASPVRVLPGVTIGTSARFVRLLFPRAEAIRSGRGATLSSRGQDQSYLHLYRNNLSRAVAATGGRDPRTERREREGGGPFSFADR